MEYAFNYCTKVICIWLEVAPWLMLGLVVAGLIRVWLPMRRMAQWLGSGGLGAVLKAAFLGTPLPLCSCSVLPAAIALRRAGASRGATVSFLVATPENGADSIAVSYAILGPLMTSVRLVAAVISAVLSGLVTELLTGSDRSRDSKTLAKNDSILPIDGESESTITGCCGNDVESLEIHNVESCQADYLDEAQDKSQSVWSSLRYAMSDLLFDISGWMAVGVLAAAAISTSFPPSSMAQWGSGVIPMLAILFVGVPMYICATASTPIAASMLVAGVSPGTVLVFLLAGPATNVASLGILRREIGDRAVIAYLTGISAGAICLGLSLDFLLSAFDVQFRPALSQSISIMPRWLAIFSGIAMPLLSIRPLGIRLLRSLSTT